MIRSILLLAFLLPCITAKAQKIRFTDSTNVWHESGWSQSGSGGTHYSFLHSYHYNGDTMINGYHYRKLFDDYKYVGIAQSGKSLDKIGYVREDTLTGRVYIMGLGGVMVDSLVLDYNITVGDTVHNNPNFYPRYLSKVSGVDSALINGVYHKVWELKFCDTLGVLKETYHYVEGIGDIFGMSHAWVGAPYHPAFYHHRLRCYNNNGIQPVLPQKIDDFDNQAVCIVNVDEVAITGGGPIKIIPHPANSSGYLQFPRAFSGSIVILNQLGQVIISDRVYNADKWKLDGKIPAHGLYIYSITDDKTGEHRLGKFIYL